MIVLNSEIPDVKIIEPTVYRDERGYFFEAFNVNKFEEAMGFIPQFCQINESFSKKGTIRGLHLQKDPYAQSKLVRVVSGKVLDVVVDCRKSAKTFGQHISVELSSENKRQLWIPPGFCHGFQVLSDFTILNYAVDKSYQPAAEITINCFDETLKIKWKRNLKALMSKSDEQGLSFDKFSNDCLYS